MSGVYPDKVACQISARKVIKCIGYIKGEYIFEGNSCRVWSAIHEQSTDISRGVERIIAPQIHPVT